MPDLNDTFTPIAFFDDVFVKPSDKQQYRGYKFTKIEDNQKPKRTLTKETRAKISDARRKRKKQPREGQSKKSMSLYSELLREYGKNKDAKKWIEANKALMDGSGYGIDENGDEVSNPGHVQARELGITTEYTQMYADHYEYMLENVLFGDSVFDEHNEKPQDEMYDRVFGVDNEFGNDEDEQSN